MVHLVTDSPSTTHAALDGTTVRRWIRESADVFSSQRDYLTQLDAAIGDADHGINMDRGFSAAVVDLDAVDGSTPGELLTRVGSTLVYRVGGAAGRCSVDASARWATRSAPPRPSTPRTC